MTMDVIGVMFSVSVDAIRKPRFLPNTAIYVSKLAKNWTEVNGIVTQYWAIIPGGIYQVSYEPITGVDRFNILSMQECSSAD